MTQRAMFHMAAENAVENCGDSLCQGIRQRQNMESAGVGGYTNLENLGAIWHRD